MCNCNIYVKWDNGILSVYLRHKIRVQLQHICKMGQGYLVYLPITRHKAQDTVCNCNIYGKWPIHMCDVIQSYESWLSGSEAWQRYVVCKCVWMGHGSDTGRRKEHRVQLQHICEMTYSHVWCDSILWVVTLQEWGIIEICRVQVSANESWLE